MPLTRSSCRSSDRVPCRSSGRAASVYMLGLAICVSGYLVASSQAVADVLTLDGAIAKAIAFDPRLKSELVEGAARNAETYQSSLSPNPELSVDLENFLGSGDLSGFGGSELTLGIDQKFELGGKRSARIAKGQAAEDLSSAEFRALRRAVIARVAADFYEVLGAMRKVRLRLAQRKQFQELLGPLRERVEAGGSPEADLTRGQIAAEQANVVLESAQLETEAARQKLAANWSGYLSSAMHIRGRLKRPIREAMPLSAVLGRLKSHPELLKFDALRDHRLAEYDVQKTLAVPDLTLGLGVRRLAETDDVAVVAKGSIPLPIRDRNEGNILAAAERVGKAEFEREVVWQKLKRQLISAYGALHRSCHETRRYTNNIVPKARSTVTSIKKGYFRGRFKVVDLLDAISVLTEAESRQTDTLVICRIAATRIKTLTGIDPLNGQRLAKFAR